MCMCLFVRTRTQTYECAQHCLGVCVCVCVAENGCLHLGRGVCTRTDREGIELKRMRQIPPVTRSLIHTAIVLKRQVCEHCHVVLCASERVAQKIKACFILCIRVCDCICRLIRMKAKIRTVKLLMNCFWFSVNNLTGG